ncbi:MAG: TonB-dependent receptor [Tannerellaceae bacterium]|jgi:TonB-linked SusC/RagA family outer membrane protein|nr:TonB-dependent receptor [Tannerellaceae bacterium]
MKLTTFLLFCALLFAGMQPVDGQVRARRTLRGVVVSASGEPLAGASVIEPESGNGTITDIEGRFEMSVAGNAALSVSYLGFITKKVAAGDGSDLRIELEEDDEMLDEVVVVGYGVQRKVNLSGSVDRISAKELEQRPVNNIFKGLQGVIPNLNIDFSNGEPGATPGINIRGTASINGGEPLILIDGVASSAAELTMLLPADIESISALKDASSAAIYGARAAFGVILITTKQGGGDRVQVSYNNNFAWKHPTVLPAKTSDPYIYLKLKNIAVLNTPWSSGHVASDERLEWARRRSDDPSQPAVRINPLDQTQWDYMGDTDWSDYFLNTTTATTSNQASVSGSSGGLRYYFSAGIDTEDGLLAHIVDRDNFVRYSIRNKADYSIGEHFRISNNISYVATERNKPSQGYNMDTFYDFAPDDHDVNPDGAWANTTVGRSMARLADGGEESDKYDKFQATFSAEASFFERSLLINANYTLARGYGDYQWYYTKYKIGYGPEDIREEGDTRAYRRATFDNYNVFDVYATFDRTFNRRHDLTLIAGYNQEYNKNNYFSAEREGLISSSLPTIGLASGEQTVNETVRDWALRGVFFRANYTYDNRYIAEINGRYDGSSRFPENKRFGFFPSASVAWRLDSEKFFAPLYPVVSQTKLRLSYGSLGNQLVSEYGYIPTMDARQGNYLVDGKIQQIVTTPGLVSSNYTWEEITTANIGLDLGFFGNKLSATFDVYRRDTRNMLSTGRELPGMLGASEPKENAADLRTTGWELSIAYHDELRLASKPLVWNAKFVLSDNHTRITRFDNPTKMFGSYYEGFELGDIWGLQSDGLFATQEEISQLDESSIIPWGALDIVPGWPKYKDLNGDGRITKGTTADDADDLSVIGNSAPRLRFGFTFNAQWNGFDANVFIQGIAKRDYYPQSFLYWSFYQQPYAGGYEHLYDFYRPQGDSETERAKHSVSYINAGLADQNLNARYPVFQCWLADKNLGTGINEAMGLAIPQTGHLLNAAYLRVKNVTVGYTLPAALTAKVNVSRARIFIGIDNLCEWSALSKYYDPEAVTDNGYGYTYPFDRNFSAGLNITF